MRFTSATAGTGNPMQCNCCVWMTWNARWRGQKVQVARISRYWAMSASGPHASRLAARMKQKAVW